MEEEHMVKDIFCRLQGSLTTAELAEHRRPSGRPLN
jgi:hypothetical protein